VLLEVEVDPAEVPEDPEEYYDHQLVGLRVETVEGVHLGEVAEVVHLPGQDLLAVRRDGRRELLVPLVTAIVPDVDPDGGRIVIDPPPGLLELD
jgi:16S rRNA processing protein RimM